MHDQREKLAQITMQAMITAEQAPAGEQLWRQSWQRSVSKMVDSPPRFAAFASSNRLYPNPLTCARSCSRRSISTRASARAAATASATLRGSCAHCRGKGRRGTWAQKLSLQQRWHELPQLELHALPAALPQMLARACSPGHPSPLPHAVLPPAPLLALPRGPAPPRGAAPAAPPR